MGKLEKHRICPICGEDNKCTLNEECWCMDKNIPEELLGHIPEEKRGEGCVCQNCLDTFNERYEAIQELSKPKNLDIPGLGCLGDIIQEENE